jgi:hypothetical protein
LNAVLLSRAIVVVVVVVGWHVGRHQSLLVVVLAQDFVFVQIESITHAKSNFFKIQFSIHPIFFQIFIEIPLMALLASETI